MERERSPSARLMFVGIVGIILLVPLFMVYLLVHDREVQSQTAETAITAGWGGPQLMTGPLLVIPYADTETRIETVDGQERARIVETQSELYIAPERQTIQTSLDPDYKEYSIYRSVIYASETQGDAVFSLPDDLEKFGVKRGSLRLDQAELRFGISDPRGLTDNIRVLAKGQKLTLEPGGGPDATAGAGFSTAVKWDGSGALPVRWAFGLRGSKSLSLDPSGGRTEWEVKSSWKHPSFTGSFLPDKEGTEVGGEGFTATYSGITNLALGEALVSLSDRTPPASAEEDYVVESEAGVADGTATIRLVEPVDLYSQVDRAIKYGFLFIGFTFLVYFMFDVVGGARVAPAEYLLTGAGLILFFVMLLAFAEVMGFGWAYLVASTSIIGLLTAYSAAVLGSWRRAAMIGTMLTGLYATLYVLLNLEQWSLLIGSLLLFVALAVVMFATRNIDWSGIGQRAKYDGKNDDKDAQSALVSG